METITEQAANLRKAWETDRRWSGIRRDYTAEDVIRLRRSAAEEHTLARRGAQRLWELLQSQDAVRALGAITGNQAVQQVKAGLQAIYLPGWQTGRGRRPGRAHLPPPVALPGELGAADGAADQQRDAARGPDRPGGAVR